MAARKPGKVAAPVKIKQRKNHGPKRKMFHEWDSTTRMHLAQAGLLSKYHNFESFSLALTAKGIKKYISDIWADYIKVTGGNPVAQKDYFKHIELNAQRVEQEVIKKTNKKGSR